MDGGERRGMMGKLSFFCPESPPPAVGLGFWPLRPQKISLETAEAWKIAEKLGSRPTTGALTRSFKRSALKQRLFEYKFFYNTKNNMEKEKTT
jgi:hypothetical protein